MPLLPLLVYALFATLPAHAGERKDAKTAYLDAPQDCHVEFLLTSWMKRDYGKKSRGECIRAVNEDQTPTRVGYLFSGMLTFWNGQDIHSQYYAQVDGKKVPVDRLAIPVRLTYRWRIDANGSKVAGVCRDKTTDKKVPETDFAPLRGSVTHEFGRGHKQTGQTVRFAGARVSPAMKVLLTDIETRLKAEMGRCNARKNTDGYQNFTVIVEEADFTSFFNDQKPNTRPPREK